MNKDDKQIEIISSVDVSRDFPKQAFKILFEIEEKHFWFWGRNRIIGSVVDKFIKNKNISFLEVGCGTGFVLSYLEKMGFRTTGLDIHLEALKYARKRTKSPLISADILKDQLAEKFDAVGLFDVLEHIDNQAVFLKKIKKLLKRKGMLFITVPADQKLWSESDELSGHKRRYDKKNLREVLKKAKFEIKEIRYFGFLLYFPQLMFRKFKIQQGDKNFSTAFLRSYQAPKDKLNIFGKIVYLIESQIFKTYTFPFGSSLIAVAKRL